LVNQKVLYDVMSELEDGTSLKINYGDIQGQDQDWQNIPGEEVSILPVLPPTRCD
jgi:hypothetical protein